MRSVYFLVLLVIWGCSSSQPSRQPAQSTDTVVDVSFDSSQSILKIFPLEKFNNGFNFYIYLEARDINRNLINLMTDKIVVKNGKVTLKDIEVHQHSKGRYYLSFFRKISNNQLNIKVFINNSLIKSFNPISLSAVDDSKLFIKTIGHVQDGLRMRLILLDKSSRPIRLVSEPEILVTGNNAEIVDLKEVSHGIWDFNLMYPKMNQVIYLSIRAHGDFWGNIFRLQHVEK